MIFRLVGYIIYPTKSLFGDLKRGHSSGPHVVRNP